ncbi:MAG: FliA/WhiG family RNA polymerase sigma factor [Firmicutes bacterium HGW-Firmicutes-2]|jgi:RNA polymerase sigma factor for flagellar operon FliA|nr:MAG: FliA/WhiG family RNA polymerase sigma factor [Firmicutes bacterium HGW-Firmicutes-2]
MEKLSTDKLWEIYSQTKDKKIKEQLIIEYSQVVKYVAGRLSMYLGNNVEFDDLVGYGVFGLIDAIDKFDYDKGIKFETYASLRIRGAILDNIRKMDWIPRSVRKKQKDIERTYQKLESELNRPVTDSDMAEEMNITVDEYLKWQDQTKALKLTSLEDYVEKGGESNVEPLNRSRFMLPEANLEKKELKKMLVEAIKNLSEKECKVITLYYYEELTLKEISQIMEVSESRISQLHTKALGKMKQLLGNNIELLSSL